MLKWLLVVGVVALNACAQPIDAEPAPALEPQLPQVLSADSWSTPPIAIDVQVSARFADFRSDDYLAAIVGAAEQWNQATAGRVSMRVSVTDVDLGGVFIRPATTEDVSADLVGSWSLGSTACVGCYSTLVLLNLGAMGQRSKQISVPVAQLAEYAAMHELGHVLGLGHTEQGLMYRDNTQGSAACIDATTLEAFCKLHGCPPEAKPTCR